MGLDISVVTMWRVPTDEDFEKGAIYCDGESQWNESCFASRSEGLPTSPVAADDYGEGFSVGPYSFYNRWRAELARLAGYPVGMCPDGQKFGHDWGAWQSAEGPFLELIDFTDCDGTLGPVVCKKLAKDFDDFAERAAQFDWPEHKGLLIFEQFRTAIKEAAAANGAVIFH